MKYLQYILNLSPGRKHLRYLADWMQVSTSPLKWRFIRKDKAHIQMRASRTRVAVLDFTAEGECKEIRKISEIEELRRLFTDPQFDHEPKHARLFILEDLSRDMIEAFGAQYNIDPFFFRSQINDYLWYNTRDTWVEPSYSPRWMANLNFHTFRYMTPRYFHSVNSMKEATRQLGEFNVLRRLDDDDSLVILPNDPDHPARVGLVRGKASLWTRRGTDENRGIIGE
jgi:hypothetical protein